MPRGMAVPGPWSLGSHIHNVSQHGHNGLRGIWQDDGRHYDISVCFLEFMGCPGQDCQVGTLNAVRT